MGSRTGRNAGSGSFFGRCRFFRKKWSRWNRSSNVTFLSDGYFRLADLNVGFAYIGHVFRAFLLENLTNVLRLLAFDVVNSD